MSSASRKLVSVGLFLLITTIGAVIAVVLIKTRPQPKQTEQAHKGEPVQIQVLSAATHPIQVLAQGSVVAAEEVLIQPEVTGRVVWVSPELVPGGRVKKGTPLLRIDPSDYAAAVRQQLAQVESQRLALDQEHGRRIIAEREWELFGDAGAPDADPDAAGRALALREPHLRSAKASLEGASAGLQRAKLSLSRTQIIAPFNAFVQSESVDIGQIVNPSMQLGRLIGTDAFWVRVSVPVDKLSWIRIPGLNAEEGSHVSIWQDVGDGQVERVGKVIRLFGDLDPVGRMARVLVEIPDPLESFDHNAAPPKASASQAVSRDGASGPKPSSLPLLVGAFVNARIDAGQLDNVIEVPRSAIHDGDKVYVVDDEGNLRTKQLSAAWRLENSVLASSGVQSGDRVIISQLATPLEGMKVRIIDDDTTAKAEAK